MTVVSLVVLVFSFCALNVYRAQRPIHLYSKKVRADKKEIKDVRSYNQACGILLGGSGLLFGGIGAIYHFFGKSIVASIIVCALGSALCFSMFVFYERIYDRYS